MQAANTLILFIFCFNLCSQGFASDSFSDAIDQARRTKLTEVNSAKEGLPFYSVKSLDPNWDETGKTPIVKVDSINLIDQNGNPIDEKIFEGKTTFLAFFFSSCAGFCSIILHHLQKVEKKIKQFPNVQYIAISIDPTTDNPKKLQGYFKKMKFDKSWTLLTGSENQINTIAKDTFASEVFVLPKSKGQISHSEHFYVIDGKRRLRGILKGTRIDVGEQAVNLMNQLKPLDAAL